MEMHHHDGCPHDHEGDACLFGVVDAPDAPAGDESSVEETQIIADAAVEIAEIEAETEIAQIEASLEHHQIEAETEQAQIDASLEHHQIEADAADEVVEELEDLEEIVEELADVIEEVTEPELEGGDDDELEGGGEPAGDVTAVTPPPRVEAPGAPTKARRQSAFTARHSRRRR